MQETLHIYTRVSTRVQDDDGTSLDTQKELGIAKSNELGMNHKVWNEGAASSHHEDLLNRPVLVQLLGEIEGGSIKHLFVYNNDRLSRNEDTQYTVKYALRKNDVVLYTKDGRFDLNNPQDKLFKSLLDGIAEYDNAIRAERSRLGKINKVRRNEWFGGPPPFGYEIVDKKLSPHPEESKWVKKMFRWFYDGNSIVWIKSQLDKEGVVARRGKLFTTGSINVLLQNKHHIGHYDFTDKKSGETITCSCPPIVDETVWNQVQQRREQIFARKGQNNRTKRFYLLRNLMFCGECGSQMSGRIDWIDKYADRVGAVEDFTKEEKKEYLEGVLNRIEVWLDAETNDHHLDITFKMGLVGDGIEYQDDDDKGAGYTVVEGATDASIVIPYAETQDRHKDARKVGRQEQNAKKKQLW